MFNAPIARVSLISLCLPLFIGMLGCQESFNTHQVELTVDQTLKLARTFPYAMEGNHKNHLYRLAAPEANPRLIARCREFVDPDVTSDASPLILGYTGGSEEASALIEIITTMALTHREDPEAFMTGRSATFLGSVMVALGLMGRRQIPEAREFLMDVVSSADNEIYGLRWYNQNDEAATLSFALTGFVIMQPEGIEDTVARAKSRIEKKYPGFSFDQVTVRAMRHEVSLISQLEKQPITAAEREYFLEK